MGNPARRKSRLDQELVRRGLFNSREKARRSIMAGGIRVNGQLAEKPGDWVLPEDELNVLTPERFVSRGGEKLDHALTHFCLDPSGWVAVDLGASTGGFTDCLLQHGTSIVYAVDVGKGQLAWKLRNDSRVRVLEKTNARSLTCESMPAGFRPADLVTIDCSFISLRKILPAAIALLKVSGKVLALIKPQFEAGKAEADRGSGVISDPLIHTRVVAELQTFVTSEMRQQWLACIESPLLGPAGNKEFLALIEKTC